MRTLDVDSLLMADGNQSLGYCFDQLHRHLASLVVPMRGVSKDHSEVAEKVELYPCADPISHFNRRSRQRNDLRLL